LDETGEIQLMWHKDACLLITNTGIAVEEVQDQSAYKILEKFVDV
jgi:hypothetical protein